MTLIVAMVGRNEIVIGADGICHNGNLNGAYVNKSQKLRRVLKDKWVVGVSGTTGGYTVLNRAKASERGNISDLADHLDGIYREGYSCDLGFVFAGFEDNRPALYTWHGMRAGVIGLTLAEEGHVAAGLDKHGALHFMHRYHSTEMDANQLALLCHYCLSEAMRQDRRLGDPISMAVISRDAITDLDEAQLKELRDASIRMSKKIGKLFIKDAPSIYASNSPIVQT
jgi:20S proteasome alpha/beta subunit